MIVLEQNREGQRLVERRPRQPVALAGVLFLALALLPLLSEGPLTALRLLTAVALSMGAALCFFLGLPHARRLPLPERASVQRLVLAGTSSIEGYAAEAVGPSGARRIVLAGADPARVLADALALSAHLGVALDAGWGLDRGALDLFRAPAAVAPLSQPLVLSHRVVPDQAVGAGTALWAAAFIPASSAVLGLSPARPNLTPTTLALVLPGLTALYALAVGLWLLGLRERVTVANGRLDRQRQWFGKPLGGRVDTPEVVGLYPVAPLGGSSRHLLAATVSGPVSLPTDAETGVALAHYRGSVESAAGRAAE